MHHRSVRHRTQALTNRKLALSAAISLNALSASTALGAPVTVLETHDTALLPVTADPTGLAFDTTTDKMFVVDDGADVIARFTPGDSFAATHTNTTLSLAAGGTDVDTFTLTAAHLPGLSAGDSFVAWLSVDGGLGAPNTVLGSFDDQPTSMVIRTNNASGFTPTQISSLVHGAVNPDGTIRLKVSGHDDFNFNGQSDSTPANGHGEVGNYDLSVGTGNLQLFLTQPPVDDPEGAAFDGTNLWVSNGTGSGGSDASLFKINPADGSVLMSFDLPATTGGAIDDAEGLAWDGTNIWVSADQDIFKIDPTDGSLINMATLVGVDLQGLAFNGTHILAGDSNNDEILFINPATLVVDGVWDDLPDSPDGLTFDGTDVWFSDESSERLYKITAATPPLSEIPEPSTGIILAGVLTTLALNNRRNSDDSLR